ncbi:MAG: type II toxin-antitoxin system RelE/ParE family toxin [Chloroflexi bacterium]|nr:type II toxin-antitoxin system RelE/ParE family toxin [Chloroflexota bacterium]
MTWQVVLTERARRDLASLGPAVSRRLAEALRRFAEQQLGDVKRLRGRGEEWRLRVGDWRVFFTYEFGEGVLRVLRVRHRRDAYRQ